LRKAPHDKRASTAILAAVLFVVQMMISSWAMAGSVGQPMVDAFGNPLCVTDADGNPVGPSKDHRELPACCAIGCSAFSASLLAPPVETASASLVAAGRPIFVLVRPVDPAARFDHDPGNPRAPPVTL
jgi:hypothetical protein